MPDKIPKQTPNDTRVFDVAKPGTTASPDATSRPVLVTNRPIMQDPMMINKSTEPAQPQPVPTRITIKPIESAAEVSATNPASKEATSAPSPAASAQQTSTPADTPAPAVATSDSIPLETVAVSLPVDAEEDPTSANPESGVPNNSQLAKAAAAAEAEAKQRQELAEMVEKKQYFLPVDSVQKRRTRMETIFGLVLIIALALLLLDLLLDAGFIHINGLNAFTNFFS